MTAEALLAVPFDPYKQTIPNKKIIRKSEGYGDELKEKFNDSLKKPG